MVPAIVLLLIPLSEISADTQNEIPQISNRQSKNIRNWRKLRNKRQNIGTRELNRLTQNDNFQLRENYFLFGNRRFRPQVTTDDWTSLNKSTSDLVSSQFGHSHPRDTRTLKQNFPVLRKHFLKETKNRRRFPNGRQNLRNKQLDKPTKIENISTKFESDFISALTYINKYLFLDFWMIFKLTKRYYQKFLRLLLNTWPKISKNSMKIPFCCPKAKKVSAKPQSPPQELEVSPLSRPFSYYKLLN